PDHRNARSLAARDELGQRRHDGGQPLRVNAGNAQRSLVVDERVLQVDDEQRGGARIESVERHHFCSMSMPSTPLRPQLSLGVSWMTTCRWSGLQSACSTIASVMALTSLRFWSTVRPSHISTMTNGISAFLRLNRGPARDGGREARDEIVARSVLAAHEPERP